MLRKNIDKKHLFIALAIITLLPIAALLIPADAQDTGDTPLLVLAEKDKNLYQQVYPSPSGRKIVVISGWSNEAEDDEDEVEVRRPGKITVWDIEKRQLLSTAEFDYTIDSVSFSPDESKILIGATRWVEGEDEGDALLRVYDVFTGRKKIARQDGKSAGCDAENPAEWALSGKYFVSGAADKRLWKASTGRKIKSFECMIDGHYTCPFDISPSGDELAIGYIDGYMRTFSLPSGKLKHKIKVYENLLAIVFYSHDGKTIATYDDWDTNVLKVWDTTTGKMVRSGEGKCRRPYFFNLDNQSVFIGMACGEIEHKLELYDFISGKTIKGFDYSKMPERFHDKYDYIYSYPIGMTNDGKLLISKSNGADLFFWSIDTGELKYTLEALADGGWIVYSPEGYFDISPDSAGAIKWQTGKGEFPAETYFDKYNRPGLAAEVMGGGLKIRSGFTGSL